MTIATTTRFTTRFDEPAWAVTWGPGLTQTAIATSEAEAERIAAAVEAGEDWRTPVEPLVCIHGHSDPEWCPLYAG